MKNHELLDMIGEANEDYVLAAGDNVVRPRFGWKKLAACAACAALVLGAYPIWKAAQPHDTPLQGIAPLHAYTVVEGGGTLDTLGDIKAEAGGADEQSAPGTVPGGAYVGGEDAIGNDNGQEGLDGTSYNVPGQDAPAQEQAQAQYQGLLQGMGGQGGYEPDVYPDWFAGSWIDNSYQPESKLVVAIVNGFRTAELEARVEGWCGGEIVFMDAKYSLEHLNGLMEPATQALDGTGLSCGIGVDVMDNCLGVDLYSDGKVIPDDVLAALAHLDPDGDAIQVRLFTQSLSTLTDEIKKGPAPDAVATPVPGGAREVPAVEEHIPEEIPSRTENAQSARYDTQPRRMDDLPEAKSDVIYGAES